MSGPRGSQTTISAINRRDAVATPRSPADSAGRYLLRDKVTEETNVCRWPRRVLPASLATIIVVGSLMLSACGQPTSITKNNSSPADSANAATALEVRALSDQELSEGWISLFDGQTLFGWTAHCNADWRVEDDAIVVSSGDQGLLCTTTPFDDYELKIDFRSDEGTNSGVFLRTLPIIGPNDVDKNCYELNIAGKDNPFPTGSLVQRQKVTGDYQSDQWQSYEVTVRGGQISVRLDGVQILDYSDPQPISQGLIGLQHNSGKVAFRKIKLKPLGLESLFNGKDLSGWRTYPDMTSKFTVTSDGEFNVRDGPGQLETESEFGDFILQLECISHAEQLNSGIFFRCIPGEQMNGYESQIHNGRRDGDRSRPVDCGTGGIFRRQDARLVVADDLKWFHKTIIADGPHMAVWVNGFQVSDWIDTRSPDANPRKGRRLEPGTIMIQGHDPTTNLSFRKLRIRPISMRQ